MPRLSVAERGFHKGTLQDVIRVSGLSPGSICSHFGSKEDIVYAVVEAHMPTIFVTLSLL